MQMNPFILKVNMTLIIDRQPEPFRSRSTRTAQEYSMSTIASSTANAQQRIVQCVPTFSEAF